MAPIAEPPTHFYSVIPIIEFERARLSLSRFNWNFTSRLISYFISWSKMSSKRSECVTEVPRTEDIVVSIALSIRVSIISSSVKFLKVESRIDIERSVVTFVRVDAF